MRFLHPYKECFVPLSNRCGISLSQDERFDRFDEQVTVVVLIKARKTPSQRFHYSNAASDEELENKTNKKFITVITDSPL